ncbi:hypothetical protein AXA44_20160 [Rhodococcus sp. SC4]|nr:hypothetical protein AXA44_20160 [Rhodococcus sp. SC4]
MSSSTVASPRGESVQEIVVGQCFTQGFVVQCESLDVLGEDVCPLAKCVDVSAFAARAGREFCFECADPLS